MIAKFNKTKSFVSVEWGLGHPKYLIIYKKSVRNERVKKVLDPVLASVAVIMIGYRGPIPSGDILEAFINLFVELFTYLWTSRRFHYNIE